MYIISHFLFLIYIFQNIIIYNDSLPFNRQLRKPTSITGRFPIVFSLSSDLKQILYDVNKDYKEYKYFLGFSKKDYNYKLLFRNKFFYQQSTF